jgi:hypothetical protein
LKNMCSHWVCCDVNAQVLQSILSSIPQTLSDMASKQNKQLKQLFRFLSTGSSPAV